MSRTMGRPHYEVEPDGDGGWQVIRRSPIGFGRSMAAYRDQNVAKAIAALLTIFANRETS